MIKNCLNSKCNTEFDSYSKYGTKIFCSQTCNSLHQNDIRRKQAEDLYYESPNICKQCNSTISFKDRKYKLIFCSRSCSAKFNNKDRINIEKQNQKILKIQNINQSKKDIAEFRYCLICNSDITSTNRKSTCSKKCFAINATNNALKQTKHGGGYKGIYKGIHCDSSYELVFLIYHLDHNIPISRSTNIYSYEYKNKIGKYIPDFIVNELEYEIKGFMTNRSKAKLSQNSHIILIDKLNIKSYIKYVKQIYKIKDFRELYDNPIPFRYVCKYCDLSFTSFKKNRVYCSPICCQKNSPKKMRNKESKMAEDFGFEPNCSLGSKPSDHTKQSHPQ